MFEITAKTNYKDTRPEFIEEYRDKEIKYNSDGSAAIKQGDIYIINNKTRAEEIKKARQTIFSKLRKLSSKESEITQ